MFALSQSIFDRLEHKTHTLDHGVSRTESALLYTEICVGLARGVPIKSRAEFPTTTPRVSILVAQEKV